MTVRTAQWLKDYFMERNPNDYNRDLVDSFAQSAWALGRGTIYYVAYGGDDGNPGTDPDSPLETITQALSLCSDDKGDIVYVLSWYLNEAGPIVLNKRAVSVIGAFGGSGRRPHTWMMPSGDTAMFSISSQGTLVHNIMMDGGASHGAIEYVAGAANQYSLVSNCWFGFIQASLAGVWSASTPNTPSNYSAVDGCKFGPLLTGSGILWESNGAFCRLSRNHFNAVPGINISLPVTCAGGRGAITGNTFSLDSDAAGRAITLGVQVYGWWIDGNHAHYGNTAMAQNPFRDLSAIAGVNNWGLNYSNILAVLPAVV